MTRMQPIDPATAAEVLAPTPAGRELATLPKPPAVQRPRPVARPARMMRRHHGVIASFLIGVMLPVLVTAAYLFGWAEDRFASVTGFTVRGADGVTTTDLLGGIGKAIGGGATSGDADVLYEFIRSQELVALIDKRLDLRAIWSRPREGDPLLSYDPSGTIEDLTDYWRRMVRVSYDTTSGLIEVRAQAFAAVEAQAIATAIHDESSRRINTLSATAREDALRHARDDLATAEARLGAAREGIAVFRRTNSMAEPTADLQGRMAVVNALESQLAEALIAVELLAQNAHEKNPRMQQAQLRIQAIRDRIAAERAKFGADSPEGEGYAATLAEYERLTVEREFAERSYMATLAAHDAARAEANRNSRYLATYIHPTLAERADFPQRWLTIGMVALFSFLGWSILTLVFYSIRDRR